MMGTKKTSTRVVFIIFVSFYLPVFYSITECNNKMWFIHRCNLSVTFFFSLSAMQILTVQLILPNFLENKLQYQNEHVVRFNNELLLGKRISVNH